MTARFAWVDEYEMFALVLVRFADPTQLARELGATVEETATTRSPLSHVTFTCASVGDWSYAAAFHPGLMGGDRMAQLERGRDVTSFWFDIHANSEFRLVRDGVLVRSFPVIGYGEPSIGDRLPEESGLFTKNTDWDERSDGLELVARVTGSEPALSWFPGGDGPLLSTTVAH